MDIGGCLRLYHGDVQFRGNGLGGSEGLMVSMR